MTPPKCRPAFMMAALGAMTPSVGFADTVAATEISPPGTARQGWLQTSIVVDLCIVALVGLAALLVRGRIGWRIGAVMIVAGGVLIGGGAIVDGFQTAVAVSR